MDARRGVLVRREGLKQAVPAATPAIDDPGMGSE
jgi:hypothetical protein